MDASSDSTSDSESGPPYTSYRPYRWPHQSLCNNGSQPLSVPGFGGVDLRYTIPLEKRFGHPEDGGCQFYLTARELAVLRAINTITDEPGWHLAVLNQNQNHARLSEWQERAAATSSPPGLINEAAWLWIIRELHDKALTFASTGRILVYDTGAKGSLDPPLDESWRADGGISGMSVSKSDNVQLDLIDELEILSSPLRTHGVGNVHLVNPAMFPLVYNRTPVLTEIGETVGLLDPSELFGKGSTATDGNIHRCEERLSMQWLPCEVVFTSNKELEITSYINNLDPTRFGRLYDPIQKFMSLALPAWNDVLVKGNDGRYPSRINTFGLDFYPRRDYRDLPWIDDREMLDDEEARLAAVEYIEKYLQQPDLPAPSEGPDEEFRHIDDGEWKEDWRRHGIGEPGTPWEDLLWRKWSQIRTLRSKHPEIGEALTYEDWRDGKTSACVVPPNIFVDTYATSIPGHIFQKSDVSLEETFRQKGLQIVVRLSSINLTPTSPIYEASNWEVEGTSNERIVGVAMFPFSVENISSESTIAFRCRTAGSGCYEFDITDLDTLIEIIPVDLKDNQQLEYVYYGESLLRSQRIGSVALPRGRMVAWSNHLRYKLGPIELEDKTKPGHLKYLTLCLVDPHYRVCSTRNVPPQQPEYWFEKAMREVVPSTIRLPPELQNSIFEEAEAHGWPISIQEASKISKVDRRMTNDDHHVSMWGQCACGCA